MLGLYDVHLAELALWEHRWADADAAVDDALAMARSHDADQLRVRFCAKGLRAQAELAALARARRDADGASATGSLGARKLLGRRSARRRRGLGDHAERGRLAGGGRGRARAGARRRAP